MQGCNDDGRMVGMARSGPSLSLAEIYGRCAAAAGGWQGGGRRGEEAHATGKARCPILAQLAIHGMHSYLSCHSWASGE